MPRARRNLGRSLALALALAIAAADVAVLVARSGGDVGAPAPRPTASASPTVAPETLEEQYARVARTVAELRGLAFTELPDPVFLAPDELTARIRELSEYPEAEQALDEALLRLLGAIPDGYDLGAALGATLEEQVAGFYDPETGEMVVGVQAAGRRLSPFEELTLAHELEHALADQALGLPELEAPAGEEDAGLAARALIEGDASVLMEDYLGGAMSLLDQLRLAGEAFALQGQLGEIDDLPHLLRRSLLFPYLEGAAFVAALRASGGWAAVDAAYTHRLPASTAQILWPQRYLDDEAPRPVRGPSSLPAPWQRERAIAFGAADLLFLLEAPGGDPGQSVAAPLDEAAAWAGGTLHQWGRDGAAAIGFVLADRGAGELCESVVTWYVRAFPDVDPAVAAPGEALTVDGPTQDAVVRCEGGEVRVGIAPELEVARRLAS